MAHQTPRQIGGQADEKTLREEAYTPSLPEYIRNALKPLASLKLTVGLFAASIFLVFAGTLVQTRMDVWHVMDAYFRNWFAWVEYRIFFPPAWVESIVRKDWQPFFIDFPGGFYFPGGFLIGSLMAVNLIAAHLVRFTIQAKGPRLWFGLGVIATGCLATYGVIQGGASADGVQGVSVFTWNTLWWLIKLSLAASSVAGAYMVNNLGDGRKLERRLLLGCSIAIGVLVAWLLWEGERVNLGDSSMRILWQLIQATLAGIVLLIGCIMVFKKRAGVVLLHAGIGLMMLSELLVTMGAKESQMSISEGTSTSVSIDARNPELAFIDVSMAKEDHVTVIPDERLRTGANITHPDLPCDVEIVKYFRNAKLCMLQPDDENLATVGRGLRETVKEMPVGNGVTSDSKFDSPAAYVKLTEKESGKSLGTWLLFGQVNQNAEMVMIDGKPYQIALRFEHLYRDYKIHLNDIITENYPGTSTAKNFEAKIEIVDPNVSKNRSARVWMNNPLRYRGLTYYQSGVGSDGLGRETTTFQVVANHGWMIPYVSCMIVAVGLFYHFGLVLIRFLRRGAWRTTAVKWGFKFSDWVIPGAVVFIAFLWIGSQARPARVAVGGMDLTAFGKLPIVDQGRVKPIDSFARTTLRLISNSDEVTIYPTEGSSSSRKETLTAVKWFLDVVARRPEGFENPVIRIDHPDILNMLDLPRRKGLKYSMSELSGKFEIIGNEFTEINKRDSVEWTAYDRRIVELWKRLTEYRDLPLAFYAPHVDLPTEAEMKKSPQASLKKFIEAEKLNEQFLASLEQSQPPSVIPVLSASERKNEQNTQWTKWQPLSYRQALAISRVIRKVQGTDFLQRSIFDLEGNAAAKNWMLLLEAYRTKNADEFNKQVSRLRTLLQQSEPENLDFATSDFEVFFNHVMPFYHSSVLYLIAFVITVLTWFGGKTAATLNRSAFALIAFTLVMHTWAIWARMQISGRPPVTNLYTTAIFIGWATVLFGLVFEGLYKIGVGNVLAALTGYASLLISHGMSEGGDTFTVLVAVLDTQFWLATHVVTINLGYATTFVSGTLGILYILRGMCTPSLTPEIGKSIARMIYGTLCFGMFFSFVGTVLGGLWGDDSWGRFWGWDPKENGALIIVLWTAMVLHARWDGLVKDRGLAVLAIGGNIWCAWSWFGVNQLGVGLHSYGSTAGTLEKLGMFTLSQLVLIGVGCLPKSCWWSFRSPQEKVAEVKNEGEQGV